MLNDADILYAGQASDDDKRLFVTFSVESRLDSKATAEANDGMNKYRDVDFITIRVPGDKTTTVHRPVRPIDKQRFPLQWAAFKNSKEEAILGTPLALWPGCKPSQVKELEYFNVRTVEQLAAMPDGVGGASMMGINALRQAARQFVEARKAEAPLIKVQEELKSRDNQISAMEAQLAQQGELINRLLAANEAKAPAKGK